MQEWITTEVRGNEFKDVVKMILNRGDLKVEDVNIEDVNIEDVNIEDPKRSQQDLNLKGLKRTQKISEIS